MYCKRKIYLAKAILIIYFLLLICLLFFSSNITPHITVVLPELITQMVSLDNHQKFIFLIGGFILVSIFCLGMIHYFFNAYFFQIVSFIPILILSFIRSWSSCKAISVAGFKVVSNNTGIVASNLFGSSVSLLFVFLFIICLLISNHIITKYGSQLSTVSDTAIAPVVALQFLQASLDNSVGPDVYEKDSLRVESGEKEIRIKKKESDNSDYIAWQKDQATRFFLGAAVLFTIYVVLAFIGGRK